MSSGQGVSTAQAASTLSVRGRPSPEELAVVVALLTRPVSAPPDPPPSTSRWAARDTLVRRPITPGPGAWQGAGWASH